MTSRRSVVPVLALLAACQQSTVTAPSRLIITKASPSDASARGGTRVVLSGSGFERDMQVRVRDIPAQVISVEPSALTIETPTMVAGPASVQVANTTLHASLDPGLTIDPIPIEFATVPPWQLPVMPGPVNALAVLPGGGSSVPQIAAGTSAGLFILQWISPGSLGSTPLSLTSQPQDLDGGMDGGMAPPEPGVTALAVDPESSLMALCDEDAAAPMQLIDVSTSPPTLKADAIQQSVPCQALAFLKVDPAAPRWLVAQTPAGLSVWQPSGGQFVPATQPVPMLPGPVTALLATSLTGSEELLVAGSTDSGFWDGVFTLSPNAMSGQDRLDMPFPVPDSSGLAFATLDANHDGVTDVYIAGPGQDALLIGDGHGAYFNDADQLLPFEVSTGRAVAAADFNLDGWTDIAVATEDGPDRLFISSGATFSDQTPALGLDGPYGSDAIAVADIDGDGDEDILTGGTFPGGLRLRLMVDPASAAAP